MNDKDPRTFAPAETEINHNQDPTAELRAVASHIDEILEADTEGKRTSAANYDPYGPKSKVEHAVGDRYSESIHRTKENDYTTYSVAYGTTVEAPQPDASQPNYNPYDVVQTRYTFNLSTDGTVSDLMKNGTMSRGIAEGGEKVADEDIASALTDIQKTITDGLEKDTLRADSLDHTLATDPVAEQEKQQHQRPRGLVGALAAKLGLGKDRS